MRTDAETIELVKSAVCQVFGLPLSAMTSSARPQRIAWPRQIAMSLSYDASEASFSEVGSHFGNRGHATVHHAIKTVRDLVEVSAHCREQWVTCCRKRDELIGAEEFAMAVASTG